MTTSSSERIHNLTPTGIMSGSTTAIQQRELTEWTAKTLGAEGHEIAALMRPGDDGQPVVFLHGIACSVRFWPTALPADAFRARPCLSLSLPGHAPSRVPAGFRARDVTPQMFSNVLASAVRESFDGQRVHLVGWSTGGFAALAVAAHHPELVASVTSISGFARGRWGAAMGVMQRLASWGPPTRRLFRQSVSAVGQYRWVYNQVMRSFAGRAGLGMESDPAHEVLFRDLSQHDLTVQAELMRGLRDADLSVDLPRITAPVLVVGGQRDPVVPFSEARYLASEIRNAELLELEDCGHLFFAEAPDKTFDALNKWVELHD